MEVEILVAEVGARQPPRTRCSTSSTTARVVDEDRYSVIGGDAEAIGTRLEAAYQPGLDLAGALRAAVGALAGPDRTLAPGELEVAVLRAAPTAAGPSAASRTPSSRDAARLTA